MNSLSLIGFLAFFVVSIVVGVRLLLLWRRTRQLPELLMGIGVLGIGPVGFGCTTIGVATLSNPPVANMGFGIGTVAAGILAKCTFNGFVYRRRSVVAMATTLGVAAMLIAILATHLITGEWIPKAAMAWDTLCRSLAQVGCLLWGSAESLNYGSRMRLHLRLGLTDPVLVNRFLMWAVGAGFAGTGTGVTAEIVTGVPSLQIPWVVSTSSIFGFIAAVAIYLAFVPPERYVRFVRSRA